MSNVIEFKPKPTQEPEDRLLYTVELGERSTHFYSETDEDGIDPRDAAEHLFQAAYYVHADTDNCQALVMIGGERTDTYRGENSFETEAQCKWLERRLDDVYENLTGHRRPSIFQRFRAFIRNLFNRSRP